MEKLKTGLLMLVYVLIIASLTWCLVYNIIHPELTQFEVFIEFFKLFT